MFGFPFRKKEENMCPQDDAYSIYRKPAPPSCSSPFVPPFRLSYHNSNTGSFIALRAPSTKVSQSYRVQGSLIHDLSKISGVSKLEPPRRVEEGVHENCDADVRSCVLWGLAGELLWDRASAPRRASARRVQQLCGPPWQMMEVN